MSGASQEVERTVTDDSALLSVIMFNIFFNFFLVHNILHNNVLSVLCNIVKMHHNI